MRDDLFVTFCHLGCKSKLDRPRALSRFLNEIHFIHHPEDDQVGINHISQLYVSRYENVAVTRNITQHNRCKILNFQIFDFDKQTKAVLWMNTRNYSFEQANLDTPIRTIDVPSITYNRFHARRYQEGAMNIPQVHSIPLIQEEAFIKKPKASLVFV